MDCNPAADVQWNWCFSVFNMLHRISPHRGFCEEVINESIVATIISCGEAPGHCETLGIVFVLFKQNDMFLKRRCQRRENPQYYFCHRSFAERATISRTKRALQSPQITE